MKRNAFLSMALIISLAAAVAAQTATITNEDRAAANEAFTKQDWPASAAAYQKIVDAEGKNAGANYRLGLSLLNQGKAKQAAAPLDAAFTLSPNSVFAFAAARAHAANGEKDAMYDALEKSMKLGGISSDSFEGIKHFDAFRGDAKFTETVKKLDGVANPCRARPEFRQFDFWIGEWTPQNSQGITVGTSSIQLILKDCVIFENWNTPVSSGKSFSLFNANDGKWHQTWVDGRGSYTQFVGGLADGKMVLVAENTTNGKKILQRMTFSKLEDGSVRQHGETSSDDGKTWATTYDFKYVKAK